MKQRLTILALIAVYLILSIVTRGWAWTWIIWVIYAVYQSTKSE